jgi:hypothetical protein
LLCIVTFGRKIVGPAGRREAATGEHGDEDAAKHGGEDGGEDAGRAAEDGGEDAGRAAEHGAVHANFVSEYGFAYATDAFSFSISSSTTCCRHSCKSLDNLVVSFMIVLPCSFICTTQRAFECFTLYKSILNLISNMQPLLFCAEYIRGIE